MKKMINCLKKLLLLIVVLSGAVTEMQAQVVVRRPGGVTVVGRPVAPGYYYGPRLYGGGVFVTGVPVYYTTTYTASAPRYYYKDGVYYEKTDQADVVNPGNRVPVLPSVGTIVPSIPDGARKIEVDGKTYFEHENVQYKQVIVDNAIKYEIAAYTISSDKNKKNK